MSTQRKCEKSETETEKKTESNIAHAFNLYVCLLQNYII